jgi:hypothetical protein
MALALSDGRFQFMRFHVKLRTIAVARASSGLGGVRASHGIGAIAVSFPRASKIQLSRDSHCSESPSRMRAPDAPNLKRCAAPRLPACWAVSAGIHTTIAQPQARPSSCANSCEAWGLVLRDGAGGEPTEAAAGAASGNCKTTAALRARPHGVRARRLGLRPREGANTSRAAAAGKIAIRNLRCAAPVRAEGWRRHPDRTMPIRIRPPGRPHRPERFARATGTPSPGTTQTRRFCAPSGQSHGARKPRRARPAPSTTVASVGDEGVTTRDAVQVRRWPACRARATAASDGKTRDILCVVARGKSRLPQWMRGRPHRRGS